MLNTAGAHQLMSTVCFPLCSAEGTALPSPYSLFGGAFSFVRWGGDLPLPLFSGQSGFSGDLGKKCVINFQMCFIACIVLVFMCVVILNQPQKMWEAQDSLHKNLFYFFFNQLGGGISCPALHHPKSLWKPVKTFPLSSPPFIPTLSSDLCSTVAKQTNREKSAVDQSSFSVLSHGDSKGSL